MSDRYVGVWEKAAGPDWVARHGLTDQQYQALFNDLVPKGYRPTILDAYTVAGQDRFLAMFEKRTGPTWVARHGLDANQYQALFNELVPQGYRPKLLSGYGVGGQHRFVASFEKPAQAPAFVARHAMTAEQYQDLFNDLLPKGFRPVVLNGYNVDGATFYIASFEQTAGPAFGARHDLSSQELASVYNYHTSHGFRPKIISGYRVNGMPRYLAYFEQQTSGPLALRQDLNGSDYQAAFTALSSSGYRPMLLSAFDLVSHLKIELSRVHCGNTEDVTGADSLYIVGGASDGKASHGALTTPMQINDNQERVFPADQRLVFEADVLPDSVVHVGLRAYDEDFAKDWSEYQATVQALTDAISKGMQSTKDPKVVIGGKILEYAMKAFDFFASHDKDDLLGDLSYDVSLNGPATEEFVWKLYNKGDFFGYSSWNYSIVLSVQRS